MKTSKIFLFFFLLNSNFLFFSQEFRGGEFKFNESKTESLTESQRRRVIEDLKESKKQLKTQNKYITTSRKQLNTLFIWPVKKASNVNYNEIWVVSGYVDHNPAYPNQKTDYNGGTKTYDTTSGYNNQGTDIFAWPYGWKMVDEDGLEVIAASEGQIIYKHDGAYDRNCSYNEDLLWNAVYIRHNDGSVAWYGHLKNGSLTTKNIGDRVSQGEYLGIVGSSGNSTEPHLHFEVYEDDTYTQDKLIDPFSGPSNNWNNTSWWQTQKPYRNPTINALTTNSIPPDFGDCSDTEITNEKDVFSLNEWVFFTVFLKDQLDITLTLTVYKPDNSIAYTQSGLLEQDYSASYYYISGPVEVEGQWRLEATLNTGEVVNHYFNVGNSLSIHDYYSNKIDIYPNPIKDHLFINSKVKVNKIIISDVLGKEIFVSKEKFINTKKLSVTFLPKGLYFITILDDNLNKSIYKIIKD